MRSALVQKSITDLTRRRSRAFFAVATLALAVASIGLLAMPALMDRSMQAEVRSGRLPDLTVWTGALVLDDTRLAALAALPNVRAVEPRSFFGARIYVGARRAPAYVMGVSDFTRQSVDVVHVASGSAPRADEVLTDVQNSHQGLFRGGARDTVRIIAADGSVRKLRISGAGNNLGGGQDVASDNVVVLYAKPATVSALSGVQGFSSLAFRLDDTRTAAVTATIAAVRGNLRGVPGFSGFSDLPTVRAAGDWPGKADFESIAKFFYVITALALLSALVLISNTMTTLVAQQTAEIGVMKAIGGRRRQIALVYVKTALALGALGTAVGVVLGVVLSNLIVRYFGSMFFAIDAGFQVDPKVLLLSIVVGLLAPPLAAWPAIHRGVRVDLRQALEATGSAVGGQDAGDRLLRRARFLPRTAQIGLRNLGRRRRRSVATALIVALAVGNLLAVQGLAAAVSQTAHASWRDHGEDVKVTSIGRRPLDARAVRLMRATPGVAAVEPMFASDTALAGKDAVVWSVQRRTMFRYRISDGRWFTAAEEHSRARVAVIEESIARATGTKLGDLVTLETATGPARFRVVGIAGNQQEFGTTIFVPLTTMRAILGASPAATNDYWVQTTAHDHALIDRTTTRLEDTLTTHGYDVGTEIEYVGEAADVANFHTFTTAIGVLGFLIIGISMAGLANAITMSVIERTREVGILRCIGARARDVRRIFATEGLAIALAGWLLGIPLGYLLNRLLVWLVRVVVNLDVPVVFPPGNLLLALVGTIALALLITLLPIRRAVRYRPGDALRYA
jgi:putative ABC transport system permease protein